MNYSKYLFSDIIYYRTSLRPHLGSVLSCILFNQIEIEFAENPNGFQRNIDSWTKELGFSVREFRTAFDRIGIRYKSKTEFNSKKGFEFTKNGKQYFYCSVIDRQNHVTYYYRNHMLLDDFYNYIENSETSKEFIGLKNSKDENSK